MDKYTYRVTWSKEDNEYIGLCAEFPGLSWLARTQEAASAGIRDVVKQVIQDMQSSGEPIPQPLATRRYREGLQSVSRQMCTGSFRYKLRNLRLVSTVLSAPNYPANPSKI